MDISEENRAAYDSLAQKYAQRRKILRPNNEKLIEIYDSYIRKLSSKQNPSVLDVGVGSGLNLSIFEAKGYETFGIEISDKMIEVAKQVAPNSVYYHGDFMQYQFDRRFDGVYAQAFIHLFPKQDVRGVFERFFEVLLFFNYNS
jgi:ubiquinone/menaquinone biosynthesis C-methylase UbiE